MSLDPPGNRPEPEDKRSTQSRDAGEFNPKTDTGRHAIPKSPVMPKFAGQVQVRSARDDTRPMRRRTLPRLPSRRMGCWLPGLSIGVIVLALVVLALFLPPVSLWDTLDRQTSGQKETPEPASAQTLGFAALTAESNSVTVDGLMIAADPGALTKPFSVQVVSLPPADYLAGNIPTEGWHCKTDLPPNHALASPVYSLTQGGTAPDRITLQVAALPGADPAALELQVWNAATGAWEFLSSGADQAGTFALQIDYLPRCLAVFREAESVRHVGVTLGVADTFTPEVLTANARLYPGSLSPTATGALDVVLAPGFQTGQGYDVLPLVTNFDDPAVIDIATVQHLLDNAGLRSEHVRQIAAFVLGPQAGYAGVVIDYRGIPPDLRDQYTAFIRELADLLHSQNRTLTVVLPTPAFDEASQGWSTGGYDWRALGRAADELAILAPPDPQAYAPGGMVDRLLTWVATQISRSQLLLGVDALSVEDQGGGVLAPVALEDALGHVGQIQLTGAQSEPLDSLTPGQAATVQLVNPSGLRAQPGYDDTAHTPFVRYLDADGKVLRTMWITDSAALFARIDRAVEYNLGGVVVWNVMSPDVVPGLDTALLAYRLHQTVQANPDDQAVEWIVRAGDTEIARGTGPLDSPFSFQAGQGEGTLTVEARLYGVTLASTDIPVVAAPPTLTPTGTPAPTETALSTETPLPSATPALTGTPLATEAPLPSETSAPTLTISPQPTETALPSATPTLTFTPLPTNTPVPTVTPSPQATPTLPAGVEVVPLPGGPAASATPVPVTSVPPVSLDLPLPTVDPAILAAADIGKTFEAGGFLSYVGPAILQVGQARLKWVKLEVTYRLGAAPEEQQQNINDVQANGFHILLNVVGDREEFASADRASYIAQYAAYVGALAGYGAEGIEIWHDMNMQMAADEYMPLLAWSYSAIKTAHPGTMVITGALTPTASAENPEQGDGLYFERLASAGAAQYADCIGAQYTLGTVPPTSTRGDPRGDNPIYYLPSATDRAWNAFDGALPVCYTRFGYLSPEGYPSLPVEYAWAQNTTATQQAQWLTDAIQLSMEGTQVRLLIIWSIDSAAFGGGSPEEGYAIVRPDRSCPACESIAALFK